MSKKQKYSFQVLFVFFVSAGFFFSGLFLLWAGTLKMPDFSTFEERRVAQSTKIYDRTGEVLLYDVHENVKRTVVPWDKISLHIKNATVAIEDAEFYSHNGIRPVAFLRAVLVNVGSLDFSQGGSTITQQVIKNSVLTHEKKISRKLKEWVLAVKLDKALSKEEILALYLNEIPYGGSMYGVEEASRTFFGKGASEITLTEAAYLAALPQAPTFYSPYGNNRDRLEERKNLVLFRMKELGFITEEEYTEAKSISVVFKKREDEGIKAPHFVLYVKEYLEQKYGRDAVEQGGLTVITTLDYRFQEKAEEIVKTFALENEKNFNAENAGLVSLDPKTGHILALVGSRDYFDTNIDGNVNVVLSKRQPGSTFKPLVYAAAFRKGFTPETVVFDLPTQFETTCSPEGLPLVRGKTIEDCYSPQNYDGLFRGPMTLREALAQSINIPAIKTLYLSGMNDALRLAKDLGLTTLGDIGRYGLTLVLGGGEVTLLEITNAYGVFANDGVYTKATPIISVKDTSGVVLEEYTPSSRAALEPDIARSISDILSDNEARIPAYGPRSNLYFPSRQVAVKTGTTNDYRDAWIIGYTPSFVTGAWAGNNDNSPMEKKVAGQIIAPLWNTYMNAVLEYVPDERFAKPQPLNEGLKPVLRGEWRGGVSYEIDTASGKLATENTPKETRQQKVVQNVHEILHWVDKSDPQGPLPQFPEGDPQYLFWELPVRAWALERGYIEETIDIIPKEYDDVHVSEKSPRATFTTTPLRATPQGTLLLQVQGSGTFPWKKVEYFINGEFIGVAQTLPWSLVVSIPSVKNLSQENIVRAIVYDSVFNKTEIETKLFIQ